MQKLWQKQWKLNPVIEAFETKADLMVDQKLVKHDVYGTLAQAQMLATLGILSDKELQEARDGLLKILKLNEAGKFQLALGDEDVHTKIENTLTSWYGSVGKKIHTGRSRNDQVATAIRLYAKFELMKVWQGVVELAQAFCDFAKEYQTVTLPGYTHMQKAMPSSVGLWAGSFAEALLSDLIMLKAAYCLVNQSPLGSAAGYGVPLPLKREYTAKLLGFAKVEVNSLDCQNSRGKTEANIVGALVSVLLTLNKFASDVLFFTTSDLNYFTVATTLLTGSSIMPQKKNVDVAELLRSKVHLVLGNYVALVSLASNLISGYNRDLQDTKKPLMESLELTQECLQVARILLLHLKPNISKLVQAMTPEIFATHQALALVAKGKAFRLAYQQVGQSQVQPPVTPQALARVLRESTHLGGTGNLGLPLLIKLLAAEKRKLAKEQAFSQKALAKLASGGKAI